MRPAEQIEGPGGAGPGLGEVVGVVQRPRRLVAERDAGVPVLQRPNVSKKPSSILCSTMGILNTPKPRSSKCWANSLPFNATMGGFLSFNQLRAAGE